MKGNKAITDMTKFVEESLSFLDNLYIRTFLIVILILYIAGAVPMLTPEVSSIFNNALVKIIFVLVIIYIGTKDMPLALLLAIAYVLSVQMHTKSLTIMEMAEDMEEIEEAGEAGETGTEQFSGEDVEQKLDYMFGDKGDQIPDGYNYNQYFDCVKDCAEGKTGEGPLDSPCKGVGAFEKELNAQGLNCPLGFSGLKDGSPF